ncbi:MAG: GNAT family N-acetyltransferase [Bacteroidetes bacterium]|jgi:RimJ/RimL family protein N-acetyltransferase|nr:GNAT family N-acetyltransferase [Bacteroidota bacterium]MDF1863728.1 GNAT family N-acetyltransferase [Saprospiraceae bacterium]
MKIIETNRLIITEFQNKDAAFVLTLLNTPTWLKYIGDRGVKTLEDAEKYIDQKLIKSYQDFGYGMYLVQLKDETPIGMCGLVNRPTLEDVDIGFAMLPAYAGKGFGYESAKAVLDFSKTQLKIPRIVGITVPDNTDSIKLLEKIGLVFEQKMDSNGEELLLFGINF